MIEQDVFTRVFLDLRKAGFDVYDGALPPEGTPYPFIYLSECSGGSSPLKAGNLGWLTQTVHIWTNQIYQRGSLAYMADQVERILRRITAVSGYSLLAIDATRRILFDDTTDNPLLHAVVEVKYQYT